MRGEETGTSNALPIPIQYVRDHGFRVWHRRECHHRADDAAQRITRLRSLHTSGGKGSVGEMVDRTAHEASGDRAPCR